MPIRSAPEKRSSTEYPLNQHGSGEGGVGVTGEIVRRSEHRQRPVAEELVHVSAGVDDGGHDDVEQRVEAGHRVLRGVRLGERREVANVDEHHGDLAAFTREDVVTLLQQSRREGWVDVASEGAPEVVGAPANPDCIRLNDAASAPRSSSCADR